MVEFHKWLRKGEYICFIEYIIIIETESLLLLLFSAQKFEHAFLSLSSIFPSSRNETGSLYASKEELWVQLQQFLIPKASPLKVRFMNDFHIYI